jgi:hypothetical protein
LALELDDVPSVSEMVLDGVSSLTVTGPEAVSSQLAQKNPVRASTIFFQCLYSIFLFLLFSSLWSGLRHRGR